MAEFVNYRFFDDARFGVANVQPNRALKKCRVRKLAVEYFLSEMAVVVVTPKPCRNCEKREECSGDFIFQIMEKYNVSPMGSEANYTL